MSVSQQQKWLDANQRYLSVALNTVRSYIERFTDQDEKPNVEQDHASMLAECNLDQDIEDIETPAALETLSSVFALTSFEQNLLLLCAGVVLDTQFAAAVATAQRERNSQLKGPSFSLALAVLPDAHLSALAPTAPLRRCRFIEVGSGSTVSDSPLQIDESILQYLVGVYYLDTRLNGLIEPIKSTRKLSPSNIEAADKIIETWSGGNPDVSSPVIQLCGDQDMTKRAITAQACEQLQIFLHSIHAEDIPKNSAERDALARLWEREAILSRSALLIEGYRAEHLRAVTSLVANTHSLMVVATREPLKLEGRASIRIDIEKPGTKEQLTLWQDALGVHSEKLNGQLENIISNFNVSPELIDEACTQALEGHSQIGEDDLGERLWNACRTQARRPLDELAQRIKPMATWEDLVLPKPQTDVLKEIALHVCHRFKVYETWGFVTKASRGLGISALFAGASGTGKTMAAEVMANELKLDLYRIDLSQVVSKYIGETEKNLRQVFDAAENSGAILLFDEADALFGKRSEVRDSHDRYANIEVSYLLQRMEEYRGLAILTTNMKKALDQAFLRRIRFVVQFPFPDAGQRAEIWRKIFPRQTPTNGLDVEKLSRLNVAGGNIRNIALNAAFLAAAKNESVSMQHLLQATRREYEKIERPLTHNEWRKG